MNLALFDFDGTITSSDTWTPFMRSAIRPSRMLAWVPLSPVVIGYRLGMVSGSRVRQMAARVGFRGEKVAAVRQLGAEYATKVLPGILRRSVLERIEWHRVQGDDVVVVSGSLDVYLGPWCEARGLDCICTTLEKRGDRLTGRYVQGDCVGAEKGRRILQRYQLTRYDIVYAYGDTVEDREMLELAHKKYYRGKEISCWDDVTAHGHPSVSDSDRGDETSAG